MEYHDPGSALAPGLGLSVPQRATPHLRRLRSRRVALAASDFAIQEWIHLVEDPGDGLVCSVVAIGSGKKELWIRRFTTEMLLSGGLDQLSPVHWTTVSDDQQGSAPYLVNDTWHIYAHGCHWLTYSGNPPDASEQDVWLTLAQVVELDGKWKVVRRFDLKPALNNYADPATPASLAEGNDALIIPLPTGLAVGVRSLYGPGLSFLHFSLTGSDDPAGWDYVQYTHSSYVGGPFQSQSGTPATRIDVGSAGYLRDYMLALPLPPGWQKAVELLGPQGLDTAADADIRHFAVGTDLWLDPTGGPVNWPNVMTLVRGDGYVTPAGAAGKYHLAMPTLVTLDTGAFAPSSPAPALHTGRWRLLTYRAVQVPQVNEDGGQIHRRVYACEPSPPAWVDTDSWRLVSAEVVQASGDQNPNGANRPHVVRWGNRVVTAYASGPTDRGCWVVLDDIVWARAASGLGGGL